MGYIIKKHNSLYALSLMLIAGVQGCSNRQDIPMNVVYILADDLGYGDLGCYGQGIIKTPNIDRMASEGMLFTQHYAGCTVSAPSRCSLMTGLHTGHTQVRGNSEVMPEGQQPMRSDTYTIAKLMKSAGYATGIFGKWGLGYPGSESTPNKMGFDQFYGYNCQRQSHTYYPTHLWHNDEMVNFPENENNAGKTYSPDIIQKEALQFIRDNSDRPFFAMLTYTLPHAELNLPHDSIYQLYENSFEEMPYIGKFNNQLGGYNTSKQPLASFAAMVSRLDMYVGEVIDELKRLGLEKNTLVIFTSDNGPHHEGGADPSFFNSSGGLRGTKRDLYEGGIRVPMIAWAPGKIKEGKRSDHISAFWDVMPTLADLTGTALADSTDGISFLPTLFSKKGQQQHRYLYWEFHEQGGRMAVRSGNWKLIRQPIAGKSRLELYDLSYDINEEINMAGKNPERLNELVMMMDSARSESDRFNFGMDKRR